MSDPSKGTPPPSQLKKPSTGIPSSGIPSRLPTTSGIKKPSTPTPGTASGQTSLTSSTSSIGAGATATEQAAANVAETQAAAPSPAASAIQPPKTIVKPTSGLRPPTVTASATASTSPSEAVEPKSVKSQIPGARADPSAAGAVGAGEPVDSKEVEKLKAQVKDLTEKLETLKLKRAEDRDKLREFEKSKLQVQQLTEFKTKAQELMSDLNKELQTAKDEAKKVKEEFIAYKEEMSNHEQRIEEMTVDKELAEAKLEELQDEITRLNERNEEIKLELDVLKGEIELNGSSGAAASFEVKQLEKNNEHLKAALIKLRDLSLQDKNEIAGLKKSNEELSTKLKSATKENETLKEESTVFKSQINELKDQVQATLGSVQMIEQLTEQNLDLEAKVIELRETIADLEAINEVNDQLQESAREEERELRQTLDISENRIREAERHIESLKYNLADQEKTILKFRELVKQLQAENDSLNRKLQSKLEEEKTVGTPNQPTTQYDFKQKFYEIKNFAKEVENEFNKVEIQNQKSYINHLLSYMSDQFLKKSNDHECLLALLFFKRVAGKADLLLDLLNKKNQAGGASDSDELQVANPNDPNMDDKLAFSTELFILISNIKLICNKFDHVLNTCDIKVFYNIGSLYFDFNSYEKNLDVFFELLKKDQLDENINLETLEKACVHLQTLYKNYLEANEINEVTYIIDLSKYLSNCSDSIGIDLRRLNGLITNKDEMSEIMILLKDVSAFNDTVKVTLKKIQKNLPKLDEEAGGANQMVPASEMSKKKSKLALPADVKSDLEVACEDYYKLTKTIRELHNMASNLSISLESGGFSGGGGGDADRILTAKKLEYLAFQACDKVYSKEDNGPYESVRSSIAELDKVMAKIISGLANGEYEVEISEDEYKIQKFYINSPINVASEAYKRSLSEAESLKYKLDAKEAEIKEAKKLLKMKVDELSEHKVRIGLSEKKAETTLKELDEKSKKFEQTLEDLKAENAKKEKQQTDTIEAMQQELDSLQQERNSLKEKLRHLSKKNLFDNIMQKQTAAAAGGAGGVSPAGEGGLGDSANSQQLGSKFGSLMESPTVLVQELKMLKSLNKLLMNSNKEMKKNMALHLLTSSSGGKLKQMKKVAAPKPDQKEPTAVLCKNSNVLLKELYDSLVSVKVPKLDEKSSLKNEKLIKEFKSSDFELSNNLNLIIKESDHLRTKLKHLRASLAPSGESSKTSAAADQKLLLAEIRVPKLLITPSQQQAIQDGGVVNISLKSRELKDILLRI